MKKKEDQEKEMHIQSFDAFKNSTHVKQAFELLPKIEEKWKKRKKDSWKGQKKKRFVARVRTLLEILDQDYIFPFSFSLSFFSFFFSPWKND